jgi:sugar phosphate permease
MDAVGGGHATATVRAPSRVRWTLVAPTLLVVCIIAALDRANLSIVQNNSTFLAELGLQGQQARIGLLSTSLFLAYGIGAPVWGWLVHRIGARKVAALSIMIWGLTCFWSGLATSYASLLLSRIVLGLGEAAIYPCSLALIAHWFALKERGRATAFWWVGTMIGPMVMGLIVTFLIVHFGWRLQFFAMGAIALALPLPMLWFLVRDRPTEHPSVNIAEASLIEAGSLENNKDAPGRIATAKGRPWFRNVRFWLVAVAITSSNTMYWGWAIWLPTYLRTARGFSFSLSGYLTFIIYGGAVATILVFGIVSDKIFRRAPLAGAGWLLAGAFLIASVAAPTPTWSIIFSICALCAHEVGISCAEMLMQSVVSESQMGISQGVRALLQNLIGGASPLLIGAIIQHTGNFIGAFSALSTAVVIAAGCMTTLTLEGY